MGVCYNDVIMKTLVTHMIFALVYQPRIVILLVTQIWVAFSVDSLGLTNAKSSTVSKSIDLAGAPFGSTVPADAFDPIVIDIQWSEFISQEPGVSFDINNDGVIDNIGWLTGDDDAFLVLLPEESANFQV